MIVDGTRFGQIELEDERIITFPTGLIGFASQRRFVLLERVRDGKFAWLQCLDTPSLAFPVVDASLLDVGHPQHILEEAARGAGLPTSDLAVLIIVAMRSGENHVMANMLAPLLIDIGSRVGAQVVLDPRAYASQAPMPVPPQVPEKRPTMAARLSAG